jgi:hypothetical protein
MDEGGEAHPLLPPLDLSLAASAVAPRKRGSDGATDGVAADPGVAADGDDGTGAPPPGDGVTGAPPSRDSVGAAPGSRAVEPSLGGPDVPDAERDGRTTVTVRHAVEVRVVEDEA